MKPITILALVATLISFSGKSADWKTVHGTYAVTAENYLDPAEELEGSHIRFQLSGETAKDIFLAMNVVETLDECTGATAKQIGEMQCMFHESEMRYACHFAINLALQTIEYGVAC